VSDTGDRFHGFDRGGGRPERDKQRHGHGSRGAQRKCNPGEKIAAGWRAGGFPRFDASTNFPTDRMPLAFGIGDRDAIDVVAPGREGGREVIADPLAVATLGDVRFQRGSLGSVQRVVAFSKNPGLSLAAVHDVGGNAGGELMVGRGAELARRQWLGRGD